MGESTRVPQILLRGAKKIPWRWGAPWEEEGAAWGRDLLRRAITDRHKEVAVLLRPRDMRRRIDPDRSGRSSKQNLNLLARDAGENPSELLGIHMERLAPPEVTFPSRGDLCAESAQNIGKADLVAVGFDPHDRRFPLGGLKVRLRSAGGRRRSPASREKILRSNRDGPMVWRAGMRVKKIY